MAEINNQLDAILVRLDKIIASSQAQTERIDAMLYKLTEFESRLDRLEQVVL